MRGCTRIIRKACSTLRIDNRDIDACIVECCIDWYHGQWSLSRCDLTIRARIRCIATSTGNIAKGKEPTFTKQGKQEQEDHPPFQYPSSRVFLRPRICRGRLSTL